MSIGNFLSYLQISKPLVTSLQIFLESQMWTFWDTVAIFQARFLCPGFYYFLAFSYFGPWQKLNQTLSTICGEGITRQIGIAQSSPWYGYVYFTKVTVNSLYWGHCRDLELVSWWAGVRVIAGVYFSQTRFIYFCPGFSFCPYYRGVRYSGVSARRELTVAGVDRSNVCNLFLPGIQLLSVLSGVRKARGDCTSL